MTPERRTELAMINEESTYPDADGARHSSPDQDLDDEQ